MGNSLKKRGQKMIRKFSRASTKASEEGKEHIKENLFERFSHIQNIRLLIFEWVLLIAALTMLAMTQAFWFSSSYAEDDFTFGGTYTEATIGRVSSMNPLFATTTSEKVLSKLMFATLAVADYSGHPGPGLAQSIRYSENGKVWTIRLREGLTWSDGEPLTNEDVMFTVGLIQNPAVSTVYKSNLDGVKVSEGSDGEIIFTLPAAYADFTTALEFPIVPKHILADTPVKTLVEDEFSNKPVTSGAFTFNALQTSANSDEEVIYLSANANYYGQRPLLNTIGVHTYGAKEDVIRAVNAGSVTGTAELSGLDAEKIVNGSFEKRNTAVEAGAYLFFNTSSGVMKNAALRRAVRLGISLEKLREAAPGMVALNYPFTNTQITLEKYPSIPSQDFETAYSEIAEIKGDDSLKINIATVNSGYLPAVAEELRSELEVLGFEVNLNVYEETQDFIANIIARRNYDILVYEIELGADPDPLPYYYSSQASAAGLNLSNYRNTIVDDLLVGARGTVDTKLRAKKYESFLEYWVNDVPAIGLYQANMTYIYNRNAKVYGENVRLVSAIDRFSDVQNWAVIKETKNRTP
ncbi:hypothetical protein IJH06_01815 [Candidatus Saccharibacteria bacterium]|nr:hypothetical protein [Candidatus Saccharibacteria bacterium]